MAPEARLKAGIWVAAYLRRLEALAIPAFVVRRGDQTAGAVLVTCATMDGKARAFQRSFDPMTGARTWMVLAEGDESEVDAAVARQRRFDPDLWVIELDTASAQRFAAEMAALS